MFPVKTAADNNFFISQSADFMEVHLVKTCKSLFRVLQMSGHFPWSASSDKKEIGFRIASLAFVYYTAFIASILAFSATTLYNRNIFGSGGLATESYTIGAMTYACTANMIVFRLLPCFSIQSWIHFWKELCHKLGIIWGVIPYQGREALLMNWLPLVKARVTRALVCGLLYVAATILIYLSFRVTTDEAGLALDMKTLLGFFWNTTLSSHVFYVVYLCFFLQVYSACLCLISEVLNDGLSSAMTTGMGKTLHKQNKIRISEEQENLIRACLDAFEVIEEMLTDFNNHLSIPLFLQSLMCIALITISLFLSILSLSLSYEINFYWTANTMTYVWQIVYLTWQASHVTLNAKKFLKCLYRIDAERIQGTLKRRMFLTIQRIQNDPPAVTPGHLFVIDRHLLTTMLASITTYLVILIQFRSSDSKPP